jgi:quercetin dioxygenase-like cupin family protein
MIAARSKAALLFGIIALAAPLIVIPSAQGEEPKDGWFPVGPGAEGNILSKTTTKDPFELRTEGPLDLEFNHTDIAPKGTTGLAAREGIMVVAVAAGAATVLSPQAGRCGSRAVAAGSSAILPAGTVSEIRNDGGDKLELYTISLTAQGLKAKATPPPGPCQATDPGGARTETLNHSVIEAPLTAESKGTSDVYVGAARLAPHGNVAWHTQHRPLFAGVAKSSLGLHIAHDGRCDLTVFPANAGFYEPPDMVHEIRNDTDSPGLYYVLAFAENPKPFLAPAAAPKECEKS